MRVPSNDFGARLSALEEYVEMPEERTGMTITSRLEAQHGLLVALRDDFTDFRTETTRRLTNVEHRLTNVEGRLTNVEDMLGQVLHGMTTIKNLLTPPGDATPDSRSNGQTPPPG